MGVIGSCSTFCRLTPPETNPIERVWWHLHETITRNHRCRSIDELVALAYDWFTTNNNYYLDMRNTFALAA